MKTFTLCGACLGLALVCAGAGQIGSGPPLPLQPNDNTNTVRAPFSSLAGSWHGLFMGTNLVEMATSGQVGVAVNRQGGYSGWLQLLAQRRAFAGRLKANLTARQTLTLGDQSLLLSLDFRGASNQFAGSVSGDTWSGQLSGFRKGFSAGGTPVNHYAGNYTVVVFEYELAFGSGFGRLRISPGGWATFTLQTSDLRRVIQTEPVSTTGAVPFYCVLYGGRGGALGWLHPGLPPGIGLGGEVFWFRPRGPDGVFYPHGFWTYNSLGAAPYFPPPRGTPGFPSTNAIISLYSRGFDQWLPIPLTVDAQNRFSVAPPGTNTLSLSLCAADGSLRGSFLNPVTGQTVLLEGMLLQHQTALVGTQAMGCGFFRDTNGPGNWQLLTQ